MSKLIQHKFSDLYEMSSGISSKPEQAGHGAPFVSFKTVFNNYFLPEQLPDLMNTSEDEQHIFSVREGDIFLTRTSETLDELGMSAVAYKEYPQATFSGFLKRLRPIKSGISYHKYMAFYLRSEMFRKTMNNNAIMTLRASLNEQIFSYLNLLLPSFEEQKLAGNLLFSLYEKIELNNRINAELAQLAKALYDYWFVQFDFPNANGKPYKSSGGKMVYNEILKREIPWGWEVKKLEQVMRIARGASPRPIDDYISSNGAPWIKISDATSINHWFIVETKEYIKETGVSKSRELQPGTLILSNSASPGIPRIVQIRSCVHDGWLIIDSYRNSLYNEFMLFYFENFRSKILNLGSGSIFKNLKTEYIKGMDIVLPPKELLDKSKDILENVFNRILTNVQQNQQLSSLRGWLLPMLMNGQVKVANVTKENSLENEQPILAAEPQVAFGNVPKLNIPESRKNFAKQVLAGKIVSEFKDDPNFTDIKFQKIQFLAEHIIEADLKLNYYYQAAGPYDNVFMHTIYNDFRKQKWFDCQNKRFIPQEKQEKIEEYYQGYFAPAQEQLNKLFELLYHTTEAEAEIVATLYAVWNNRIIEKRIITDHELIQDFYQWSDRKQQYVIEQVSEGLQWLRMHHMEPKGFGKLIKKSKGKK